MYKETGEVGFPEDTYTRKRMNEWFEKNKENAYLVNTITCKHIEEVFEQKNIQENESGYNAAVLLSVSRVLSTDQGG